MPIYVFKCNVCEMEFESLMRPHDPVECKGCKSKLVDKMPAVTGGHVWKCSSDGAMPKGKRDRHEH